MHAIGSPRKPTHVQPTAPPASPSDPAPAPATLPSSRAAARRPGLFWLGGFRSDMAGSKAMALDALGAERGLAVTRFDYSGHGVSGGDFNDGTISRWLEEAEAVYATTDGPQIIIGSSMGGWIALLLARALLAARHAGPGPGADRAGARHDP